MDMFKCLVFVYIKVERIKERVEEKEGIPPQQQRLIYSGKQMWALPLWTVFHCGNGKMLWSSGIHL